MGVVKPPAKGRTSLTKTKDREGRKRVSSASRTGVKLAKSSAGAGADAAGDRASELAQGYLAHAQMSKADKRSARRAELLAKQAQHAPDRSVGPGWSDAAVAALPDHAVSRSALRRRKRKRKNDLAGTAPTGRMEDMHAGLDAIVDELVPDTDAEEARKIGAAAPAGATQGQTTAQPHGTTMTSRRRKAILAQEGQRQKAVLGDLTRAPNPWAALRQHAANSLAFDSTAAANPTRR